MDVKSRWLLLSTSIVGCVAVLVAALILTLGLDATLRPLDHTPGYQLDFEVYYAQVRSLRSGSDALHDYWLYPPFAAVAMYGFAWLEPHAAHVLFFAGQVVACAMLAQHCARPLYWLPPLQRWCCAIGLVASSAPILHCLKWGQLSIVVLVLSLSALRGATPAALRARTVWGLGVGAATKLYPATYSVLFIPRANFRQWLKLSVVFGVLSILVPAYVLGAEVTRAMWQRALAAAYALHSRAGISSQTIQSLVDKWFGMPTSSLEPLLFHLPAPVIVSLKFCLPAGAVAWTLARSLQPAREALGDREIALVLTCAALVTPPAWVHYLVVVPFGQAVLLGAVCRRDRLLIPFLLSVLINSGAVLAMLPDPATFVDLQRCGAFTVAATVVLVGLWCIPTQRTQRDDESTRNDSNDSPASVRDA